MTDRGDQFDQPLTRSKTGSSFASCARAALKLTVGQTATSRSGSAYGRSLKRTPFTTENVAVEAPMLIRHRGRKPFQRIA